MPLWATIDGFGALGLVGSLNIPLLHSRLSPSILITAFFACWSQSLDRRLDSGRPSPTELRQFDAQLCTSDGAQSKLVDRQAATGTAGLQPQLHVCDAKADWEQGVYPLLGGCCNTWDHQLMMISTCMG